MDYLIELPVNTNEELNLALARIEQILRPLEPYISKNNLRKKDIVKNRRALWLIQVRRYLKNKSYNIRRWESYIKTVHNKTDGDGN